jgi:hypothetical protein
MEIIADHGRMLSFEIVEVNPVIDEHNQTADLAVETVALGVWERRFYNLKPEARRRWLRAFFRATA